MGRFITEDPIKDGNNWYVYCKNNLLSFIDPTGLEYHGISMPAGAMRDGGYDKNSNYTGFNGPSRDGKGFQQVPQQVIDAGIVDVKQYFHAFILFLINFPFTFLNLK